MSYVPLVSLGTNGAPVSKTTDRPWAVIGVGENLLLPPDWVPSAATLTRLVTPARRLRTNTSKAPLVSPATRFDANDSWVLVHMIEEYARHNGHADLLRESIDGQTGE